MTNQQTFTFVLQALRKQGVKSGRKPENEDESAQCMGDFMCFYRGPNNTKCAAGHLIEDSEYQTGMEMKGIDFLFAHNQFKNINIDNIALVSILQSIHDTCMETPEWEIKMAEVAGQYHLIYEPVI